MRLLTRLRDSRHVLSTRRVLAVVGVVVFGGVVAAAVVLLGPSLPLPPTSQAEPTAAPALSTPLAESTPESVQAEPVAASDNAGESPFAHIADPPTSPPRRTGMVTHTVESGEVLWQIAEQYDVRPETILWANDIPDADLLLVGQQLLIPPEDGVLYTVRDGDRLSDVAAHYGVGLDDIVSANHIESADEVQSGTDIFLPGARPLAGTDAAGGGATGQPTSADQAAAASEPPVPLPANIEALLAAGWLRVQQAAPLYRTADRGSGVLHPLPAGAP